GAPTVTGSGEAVILMKARSATGGSETGRTVVTTVPTLLFGFGSDVGLVASAVMLILPTTVGVTTMLRPNCVPAPRPNPLPPNLQVTVPPDSRQSSAETNVTPGGNLRMIVRSLAASGP